MTTETKAAEHETKVFAIEIKDADKGLIEATFSTFGVKDHDEDVTLPGAFEDGAKVAISAYGHRSWMGEMPVGRGKIRVEGDRAILEGKFFMSTERGRETFETVKQMGDLQEWSYGFDVLETGEITQDLREKGVRRVLKRLKVFEVSPVLRGAGIGTGTLVAKSADAPKAEPPPPEDPAETASPEVRKAALTELVRFERTRARLAVRQ